MNQKKRELEKNELADSVSTGLEKLQPHLPRIAVFAGVAVVTLIVIMFFFNAKRAVIESQWREYFVSSRSNDPRNFRTVAELYPDTQAGNLALINAANTDVTSKSFGILTRRDQYRTALRKAVEECELVLESSNASEFARARATYSLGYAFESLGRFEEARERYQDVIDFGQDTPLGKLAAKSLERVNDPFLTSIHKAFQDWVPDPDETAPGSLVPGSKLPTAPNINLPQEMEQAPLAPSESSLNQQTAEADEKSDPDQKKATPESEDANDAKEDASKADKASASEDKKVDDQ